MTKKFAQEFLVSPSHSENKGASNKVKHSFFQIMVSLLNSLRWENIEGKSVIEIQKGLGYSVHFQKSQI